MDDVKIVGVCPCGTKMVANSLWARRLPTERRHELLRAGVNRHDGRGLCHPCYQRWMKQGQPEAVPPARPQRPAVDVLEDWRWLHAQGELDATETRAARIRQAAPRLGMTEDALERALDRAKVAA